MNLKKKKKEGKEIVKNHRAFEPVHGKKLCGRG